MKKQLRRNQSLIAALVGATAFVTGVGVAAAFISRALAKRGAERDPHDPELDVEVDRMDGEGGSMQPVSPSDDVPLFS